MYTQSVVHSPCFVLPDFKYKSSDLPTELPSQLGAGDLINWHYKEYKLVIYYMYNKIPRASFTLPAVRNFYQNIFMLDYTLFYNMQKYCSGQMFKRVPGKGKGRGGEGRGGE